MLFITIPYSVNCLCNCLVLLPPLRFLGSKWPTNADYAGELTALPLPPSWIKGRQGGGASLLQRDRAMPWQQQGRPAGSPASQVQGQLKVMSDHISHITAHVVDQGHHIEGQGHTSKSRSYRKLVVIVRGQGHGIERPSVLGYDL